MRMEEEGKAEAEASEALQQRDKQRAWGLDTYNKWDDFDEHTGDDGDGDDEKLDNDALAPAGARCRAVATQFDMGRDKLVIADRNLLSAVVRSPAERKRLKALRQDKHEVWQVVIRKLRVWTAETGEQSSSGPQPSQSELVPCRPYSVTISSLYPDGKLVSQQLCHPPETRPSPERIIEFVTQACLTPLFGEQRRPNVLTFPDAELAGKLFRSFESLCVEVSELSESQGLAEVVDKYSTLLVTKDLASLGPQSARPGLLSVAGVSLPLLRPVFATLRAYAAREPWRDVVERRAFRLTAGDAVEIVSSGKTVTVAPGSAWVCVFGNDSLQAARGRPKSLGKGTYGIAVFFSKLDLEARLLPASETLFLPDEQERCSYSGASAAELGRDLKRTKPPRVDIRTGQELLFADANALRKHWPAVKRFAVPKADMERGRAQRRQHWADAECTMLFEDVTALPFDDLDLFDAEPGALAAVPKGSAPSLGSAMHPLILQFRQGAPERPTPEQLLWLHRAMRATLCLLEQGSIGKDSHEPAIVRIESHMLRGQAHQETLEVVPTPIFFTSEAEAAARSKRRTQQSSCDDRNDGRVTLQPGLEADEEDDDDGQEDEDDDGDNGDNGDEIEGKDKEETRQSADDDRADEKAKPQPGMEAEDTSDDDQHVEKMIKPGQKTCKVTDDQAKPKPCTIS